MKSREQINDSLENLLMDKSPFGWPAGGYFVGVEFEVGGAYETWGWILKKGNETVFTHRNLSGFLLGSRKYMETQMTPDDHKRKKTLMDIVRS